MDSKIQKRPAPGIPTRALETAQAGLRDIVRGATHGATVYASAAGAVLGTGFDAVHSALPLVHLDGPVDHLATVTRGHVDRFREAVDVDSNLAKLEPDDTYQLVAGLSGALEGTRGTGRGIVDVRRDADGGYTVGAQGDLGASVFSRLGMSMDGVGAAEAAIGGGAGQRVEMKLGTLAQAQEAVHILEHLTLQLPLTGANLLLGTGNRSVAGPRKSAAEEVQFLLDHVTAVDLRGQVLSDLKTSLGISDPRGQLGGLFAGGALRNDVIGRIELGEHGKATVVLRDIATGEMRGGTSFGGSATLGSQNAGGGVTRGTVTLERRIDLPEPLTRATLLHDPAATLTRAIHAATRSKSASVDRLTVLRDQSKLSFTHGPGTLEKVTFEGHALGPSLPWQAAALVLGNDREGAARLLFARDPTLTASASIRPYQQLGLTLTPSFSLMGTGAGLELGSTRRSFTVPAAPK